MTGDVVVVDVPEKARFELRVDGERAGLVQYRMLPGRIVLIHTEVEDRFQGRGLAGRLARAALDSARERGLQVTPLCPYVADYIRRHPEYVPLVDERHRAEFAPASD
ncbi:MAG TPA: GNAT family N-acetyltransferase [Streptosporangiales bacterium]